MVNIISITDIRNTSGATEELISDDKITDIITKAQSQVLSRYKLHLEPTKVFEIRDGQNSQSAVVNLPNGKTLIKHPYILKMLQLNIQETDIGLEYVQINPEQGTIRIQRGTSSPYRYFYGYRTRMKYLSGFLERTAVITESTADVIAGDNIVIAVDDETIFSINDWVIIEGADGKIEATQITATDTKEITVNNLVQTHQAESVITKLQVDESLRQFILYDSCTNIANYIVGNTSSLEISWSKEGTGATIGDVVTHWGNSYQNFTRKRDEFRKIIELKLMTIS